MIPAITLASSGISMARAATSSFINAPGTVYPMYGVPYTPPVVKYGPPPIPTATTSPIVSPVTPGFNWNTGWTPPWSHSSYPAMNFTAPTFSHWFPSFPKILNIATSDVLVAFATVAYISLLLAAVCGWTFRGGIWYLRNGRKKE